MKQMPYTDFVKHLALGELHADRVPPSALIDLGLGPLTTAAAVLETFKKHLWYTNPPPSSFVDVINETGQYRSHRSYDVVPMDIMHGIIGMVSESGEVADHLRIALIDQSPIDLEALKLELGDVLFYWTLACIGAGFTPEEVLQANVAKLMARYAHKFAPMAGGEDSAA